MCVESHVSAGGSKLPFTYILLILNDRRQLSCASVVKECRSEAHGRTTSFLVAMPEAVSTIIR